MSLPAVDNTPEQVRFRESILKLQEHIAGLNSDVPKQCALTHFFAPPDKKYGCRVYCRQIFLPAGTTIIGKIHRHGHANFILKGKVRVATEFGQQSLEAPCTFISEPGLKRAVLVDEDTIWTTVHVISGNLGEDDLDKIEDEVIAPTYGDLGLIDSTHRLKELDK